MRKTKHAVVLSEAARAQLRTLRGRGIATARRLVQARILLKADQGEGGPAWSDAAIAGALGIHPATAGRIRRQDVTDGLASADHGPYSEFTDVCTTAAGYMGADEGS